MQGYLIKRRCRLPSKKTMTLATIGLLFSFIGVLLVPALCNQEMVRIGARNTTEQKILGEIMAQAIERDTKLTVVRKFNLGGASVAQEAILSGAIDIYPEYTGTAYLVILQRDPTHPPKQLWQYLHDQYQSKFQLTWLRPFGFDNSNALLVRSDMARKFGLKTISDFAEISKNTSIGVRADFMQREDGYKGLQRVYHMQFAHIRLMDAGLMYKALTLNELSGIMGESTDGRIQAFHLQALVDDKHLFINYDAAPLVRTAPLSMCYIYLSDTIKTSLDVLMFTEILKLHQKEYGYTNGYCYINRRHGFCSCD